MRASIIISWSGQSTQLGARLRELSASVPRDQEIIVLTRSPPRDVSRRLLFRNVSQLYGIGANSSMTMAAGAHAAQGDTLLFLDRRASINHDAISQMITTVESAAGGVAVTVPTPIAVGVELDDMRIEQVSIESLRRRSGCFEIPILNSGTFAVSRLAYSVALGIDGSFDSVAASRLDLSMKLWLTGCALLVDPSLELSTDVLRPTTLSLLDGLRIAFKHFGSEHWRQWIQKVRRERKQDYAAETRPCLKNVEVSLAREKMYLQSVRIHDEYWFNDQFRLGPSIDAADASSANLRVAQLRLNRKSASDRQVGLQQFSREPRGRSVPPQ